MRLRVLLGFVALALVPACFAGDEEEDLAALDAALTLEWGEIDEDRDPIDDIEIAQALDFDDDQDDGPFEYAETLAEPPPDADDPLPSAPASSPPADGTDGAPAGSTPPAPPGPPSATATASEGRPEGCNASTSLDLDVYYERSMVDLLPALKRHAKACSRYFIGIPKVAASPKFPDAQLWPRPLRNGGVRTLGPAFRATAEVHWGGSRSEGRLYPGWKNVEVVKVGPAKYVTKPVPRARWYKNDWFLKGVLFRQRMAKRGYRPQLGETWHINELESAWSRGRVQQKAIRDFVRGLAAGDPEYDAFEDDDPVIVALPAAEKVQVNVAAHMKDLEGIVYISALGKKRPNEDSDQPWRNALKQTLRRTRFWADMAKYVDHWAQERYLPPTGYCKKGQTLTAQSDAMEKYIMEMPLMAAAVPRYRTGPRKGESPVGAVSFYLSRHYSPTVNAAWHNQSLGLPTMRSFFSGEVHATRRFANEHRYPDGRIGIYYRPKFNDGGDPNQFRAENVRFADRIASSLNAAYDGKDGAAMPACGPLGAEGCTCGD